MSVRLLEIEMTIAPGFCFSFYYFPALLFDKIVGGAIFVVDQE